MKSSMTKLLNCRSEKHRRILFRLLLARTHEGDKERERNGWFELRRNGSGSWRCSGIKLGSVKVGQNRPWAWLPTEKQQEVRLPAREAASKRNSQNRSSHWESTENCESFRWALPRSGGSIRWALSRRGTCKPSKFLRMVIDFPYYLKYDKSQDLKVYYSAIK